MSWWQSATWGTNWQGGWQGGWQSGWQDWSGWQQSEQETEQQTEQETEQQTEQQTATETEEHSIRRFPSKEQTRVMQRDIFEHGVPCKLELELYGDVWVLQVLVDEDFQHFADNVMEFLAEREGKPYHISICKDYDAEAHTDKIEAIRERWDGWEGVLDCIGWGSIGRETNDNSVCCIIGGDLAADPNIRYLHDNGYYWRRDLHISF
jgi:hypothetical protein